MEPARLIILHNGSIATQNPRMPMAQAVAIAQDRILAVGSDDRILPLAGSDTERIDLNDRLVVTGFIDTHIHFYEWALKRQGVKLDDATSLDDLLGRVRQAADDRSLSGCRPRHAADGDGGACRCRGPGRRRRPGGHGARRGRPGQPRGDRYF